jgi:hypothetical protein
VPSMVFCHCAINGENGVLGVEARCFWLKQLFGDCSAIDAFDGSINLIDENSISGGCRVGGCWYYVFGNMAYMLFLSVVLVWGERGSGENG